MRFKIFRLVVYIESSSFPLSCLWKYDATLFDTEYCKHIYIHITTWREAIIDYAKAFDCVDHKKLWKILKEMGIPEHLICLLRNMYAGQEATVRTGHGTTD